MKTERRLDRGALFRDLGYRPHAGQWAIHKSLASRRVVACGVRWGKTRAAAMEGLAAALEPAERSIGWVVAPTYDLADRVFREIEVIAFQHLKHRVISMREHDRRLLLRNTGGGISEIRGKSADNPVSLLGEGLDWVIVDEAARMKPTIWESFLSQRLIDRRGWALLISTPKGKGYFHELFRRGQGADPDYESWNQPSWKNPFLDAAVIEAERARLPQRVFAQEYEAQFTEGSGAVFRNVRECATGTLRARIGDEKCRAGLDLAKTEDFTVLTIANKAREVIYVDRFNKQDWSIQVGRIKAGLDRYGRAIALVDVTGVGDPIHEALSAAGCRVEAYPFTAKSKNALVNNLALMLEEKKLVLPRPELCPELIEELESYEYSVTDRGTVRTSAPSGQHDDCAMSLALVAWEVRWIPTLPCVRPLY